MTRQTGVSIVSLQQWEKGTQYPTDEARALLIAWYRAGCPILPEREVGDEKPEGDFFGVSQSTISNAVKEVQMARKIQDLEQQLAEVKAQVQDKYVATGKLPAYKIIDL